MAIERRARGESGHSLNISNSLPTRVPRRHASGMGGLGISSSQTFKRLTSRSCDFWTVLVIVTSAVLATWFARGYSLGTSAPCDLNPSSNLIKLPKIHRKFPNSPVGLQHAGVNAKSLGDDFVLPSSVQTSANDALEPIDMEHVVPFTSRAGAAQPETIDLASEQFPNVLPFQEMKGYDILIIGAGLSGTVLADLYARHHNKRVLIIERRPHIGGNCYDFREQRTDILVNLYGAHLFHTSKPDVWTYVHRFSEWTPYEHRVIGRVDGKLIPIPVNIDTVNTLLGEDIKSVEEMEAWLKAERQNSPVGEVDVSTAKNSREVGMGRVGERLYNKLFKEYTKKQWNVYPEDLGPVVLSRIPVRTDWDDRYFPNDKHQALPADGYTRWFEEALDHPNIRVFTSTDYFEMLKNEQFANLKFEKTFFTGQIDQFFRNRGVDLKPLQYRSIKFETIVVDEPAVNQPAFVVNFPQFRDGNHTRTAEYKHMYHQDSAQSILIREYSTDIKDGAEPYYPFPTEENQRHFEKYRELAKDEEEVNNVHFVGRLANYKYFNMDDAIQNALDLYVKLEGRKRLNAALREAKLPKETEMSVHYVVAVRNAKGLDWLSALCASPTWKSAAGSTAVRNTVFLYNMDRSLDNELLGKVREIAQHNRCALDTRLGKGIVIRNIAPTQSLELVWLEHLSAHSFAFGDSNVFIDSSIAASVVGDVPAALNLQALKLFSEGKTRAAHPNVLKTNIRLASRPKNGEWSTSGRFSKLPSSSTSKDGNLLHVLPLGKPGLSFGQHKLEAVDSMQALRMLFRDDEQPEICPTISTWAFTATDASLRRMLSIHRTAIYDKFIPELRANPTGSFAQVMHSHWYCLFFNFARK